MLLISAIIFIVGLVLEVLKKPVLGAGVQITGSILLAIFTFALSPYVAAAFIAYAVLQVIKVLR